MNSIFKYQLLFLVIFLNIIFTNAVSANIIANPGFELDESTFIFGFPGLPSSFGDWGGDASDIVTGENSITPFGTQMLRFDATGNNADPLLSSCEIYQWVDLSAYAAEISSGLATAVLSAYFNRVSGDNETDTSMSVRIYANSGSPTFTATDYTAALLSQTGSVDSDSDVATWEQAVTEMVLPINTTYLVIRINALENIFNDGIIPEFDGHYADNVSLTVEMPSSNIPTLSEWGMIIMSLILAGSAAWMIRRRQTL